MDNWPNNVRLLPYHPQYASHFARLNKAWIEKYFYLEAMDIEVFNNPGQYVIGQGGKIFFAALDDQIVGTVSLLVENEEEVKMSKLAMDEAYQGQRIGKMLAVSVIDIARKAGYKKMSLFSNTVLAPAIRMYEKLGFKSVPLGNNHYERSNIKMELNLQPMPLQHTADALLQVVQAAAIQLSQLSEEQAARKPAPNKWSSKELIGHLTDSAMNNLPRFIRGQVHEKVEVAAYDQNFWVENQQYQAQDWQELVDTWVLVNKKVARAIQSIPTKALEHQVVIGSYPAVSLSFVATDYLDHLQHHLRQIFAIHEHQTS
ncbi:ribosomal protein S18 acetylase RimI-like enzyme [Chitinophaga skermanii]|uniref:Ribosomal protein S18 acetylase RimI-like enzyme n=1 Tax=Chitinophaga skermanii TaxID=331697 RepID=A0A327QZM9_9BACT|nr:GNAT family N-acetyltransferase [Chitinophaga skermanii]RAJ08903.1 ribosomal protein S18 acetylase RimI-like enzyme [Chitinophaga skermanii]